MGVLPMRADFPRPKEALKTNFTVLEKIFVFVLTIHARTYSRKPSLYLKAMEVRLTCQWCHLMLYGSGVYGSQFEKTVHMVALNGPIICFKIMQKKLTEGVNNEKVWLYYACKLLYHFPLQIASPELIGIQIDNSSWWNARTTKEVVIKRSNAVF